MGATVIIIVIVNLYGGTTILGFYYPIVHKDSFTDSLDITNNIPRCDMGRFLSIFPPLLLGV